MHHPRCILIALLVLTSVLANGRAAASERSLDGVNFTGPLITPNPAGLPQGDSLGALRQDETTTRRANRARERYD